MKSDKITELNKRMNKAIEVTNTLINDAPIITVLAGAMLDDDENYTGCISSLNMEDLTSEQEMKVISVIFKSVVLYLQDSTGSIEIAKTIFSGALFEALSEKRDGEKYGFNKMN